MKKDEIIFFIHCYILRSGYSVYIRDVVNYLEDQIPRKRMWYYLDKRSELGFYNYGVTMDLGWFEYDKMPERYRKLIDNVYYDYINYKRED